MMKEMNEETKKSHDNKQRGGRIGAVVNIE
jgi:hypothetical protein